MDNSGISTAYLVLAENLYRDASIEPDLVEIAAQLPLLNHGLLNWLADQSQAASLVRPRYAWALMAVTDAAATYVSDHFLQVLAAWYLGRAANDWVRPDRAQPALRRARAGFDALGEEGWMAACDWQLYALPWIGNFNEAATELGRALDGLTQANFDHLVPHCRLTLAYAQILSGSHVHAAENITASEREFIGRNDPLNVARCLVIRARGLRQQAKFDQAIACLYRALTTFEPLHAPIDIAKAHYQLAYCKQYLNDDFKSAEAHFEYAINVFNELDLPLWSAQGYTGLAQIYSNVGRLTEANQVLELAAAAHAGYTANGPYADYLINRGKFHLLLGDERSGLSDFRQAEALYIQSGSLAMAAVAAMYQGEACNQLGYYQQALQNLERAYVRFDDLQYPDRLAECAMLLARGWLQLSRPEMVHSHLEKATQYYEQKKQFAFLTNVYNFRASWLLNEGQGAEAITFLDRALVAAQEQGSQPQFAFAQRLLGEVLCALGRPEDALMHLKLAYDRFIEMGMNLEQAICLATLGNCYLQMSDKSAARAAWQKALDLSQGVIPDTDWQAWAGLAQLAEAADDIEQAMRSYHQMFEALTRLRRGFSQPALAGGYLQRPTLALDRAVIFAAQIDARSATQAIEASKAQTTVRQLMIFDNQIQSAAGSERRQLEIEMRQLYDRLRIHSDSARRRSPDEKALITPLRQKNKQYSLLLERLEREALSGQNPSAFLENFDLEQFRALAAQRLGQAWIALDYYLTDSRVNYAVVTSTDCLMWQQPLTSSLRFVLDTCANAPRSGRHPTQADLVTLGQLLLPPSIGQQLTPDTYLLIAPHRQLHRVPWAALLLDRDHHPLVQASIPAVTPSLHSLYQLWLRSSSPLPPRQNGLVLGISDFGNRLRPLPQVPQEIAALSNLLEGNGQYLVNAEATWPNLQALNRGSGLRNFQFLHVASHAFYDGVNGRLSGVALYDQDVWLAQFRELAPLPNLVTLSACSGNQSLLFEGDEAVGLTTTCLAAGAQHVIGSLWPVLDQAAASLMPNFYRHFLAGEEVARALAMAQRAKIEEKKDYAQWGSFVCLGAP
ncbi:MAG TPA: CHAT domain-containing protein [Anaerolineae bacterium]|nr:CHAT domain-containing protein [Anaerolineae bacterium]